MMSSSLLLLLLLLGAYSDDVVLLVAAREPVNADAVGSGDTTHKINPHTITT